MEIRRYHLGEEEEIWQLFYNTVHIVNQRDYTKEQIERWAPQNKDMKKWAERIKKKNPFVAVEGGEVLGFGELEKDGHIDCFYVHHNYQGKGVGSELYEAIEKEAIKQKMPCLFAEVSATAKGFFLAKNFKIKEEKNNIVCGAPAPQFIMEKRLS